MAFERKGSFQSRGTWGGVCRARQPAQKHITSNCVSHVRVFERKPAMAWRQDADFFSRSRARVRTKVRDEFWRRRADFFSGSRARGERTSVAGLSKHGFEVQRSRPEFGKLRLLPTQPYRQDWVLARRIPDASGGGGFHSTWISRADMCASCSSQCGSCDSQLSGIRLGSDDGAERHRCDQAC